MEYSRNTKLIFRRIFGVFHVFFTMFLSMVEPFVPKHYFHKDVKNQIVLITGAGSGFGRLLATKFAIKHGSTVVLWDINKHGMKDTSDDIKAQGGKAFSYVVDVSSREEIYATAKKVEKEVGKVDILINNAGILESGLLVDLPDAKVEKSFRINTLAHYWITKAFLPGMVKGRRGHIVTIASSAGLAGVPKLTAYCGTKFAAVGFHESITYEVKAHYPDSKIETTVICPYFVRTPLISESEIHSNYFFPIRDPEPVVNEMIDAILTNQEYLVPSFGVKLSLFIRGNLPARVVKQLTNYGMIQFLLPDVNHVLPPTTPPKPEQYASKIQKEDLESPLSTRTSTKVA